MKSNLSWIFVFLFAFINCKQENIRQDYALAIHGGAGTILRKEMSSEKEEVYLTALNTALDIGEKILKEGGTGWNAVELRLVNLVRQKSPYVFLQRREQKLGGTKMK